MCQAGQPDASISAGEANDFLAFFAQHPRITHIYFNGSKAETVFRHRVLPFFADTQHVFTRLPSTSPAHAAMTFDEKLRAWSVVRRGLS